MEKADNKGGFSDAKAFFEVKCLKCKSTQVGFIIDGNAYGFDGGGCDTCGYGADSGTVNIEFIFKCADCGNAFTAYDEKVI